MIESNKIYCEDCLDLMYRIDSSVIDLIYIDPPFGTNKIDKIFGLNWKKAWTEEKQKYINEFFFPTLKDKETISYLWFMIPRLKEMRRVLSEHGTIYVHIDWHVGHYVKVIMDEIFGKENFRNEIVWCYTGPGAPRQQQFSRKHDVILYYSEGENWVFNSDEIRLPLKESLGGGFKGLSNARKEEYMKKEKIPEDWWYIPVIARQRIDGIKRTGYATEKPQELIKRIIMASSKEGDLVADFFSGSGMFGFIAEK